MGAAFPGRAPRTRFGRGDRAITTEATPDKRRPMRYFYGPAHEQFRPSELLRHAQLAEEAGFDGISCSDHLQPWWEPGESGHAWMWLGAAAQATRGCMIGTGVTPALQRYHPVLV